MCNIDPLMANFSIPSGPIFTKFILLEPSQKGESEFNIIISIYNNKLSN